MKEDEEGTGATRNNKKLLVARTLVARASLLVILVWGCMGIVATASQGPLWTYIDQVEAGQYG